MSSYITVRNLTNGNISFDSSLLRFSLTGLSSYNIDMVKVLGNTTLCSSLKTYLSNSKIYVVRGSEAVSSADLDYYAQGYDIYIYRQNQSYAETCVQEYVAEEGGGGGTSASTEFTATAVSLVDDTDFVLVEEVLSATSGLGVVLTLTPTAITGSCTVQLFQDSLRTNKVFEHLVDFTDPSTLFSFDTFGFEAETEGTLYGTLLCSGVPADKTMDLSLFAESLGAVGEADPIETIYGDGLEDNGSGLPQVALLSTGGLSFTSGELGISSKITAAAYVDSDSDGAFVTGAVDTTTNQTISGLKLFNSFGHVKTVASGAPTVGTYTAGTEILDSNNIKYRCITSGTPGTWELVDIVTAETNVVSTASLSSGDSELIEIPVYGNTGSCLWFRIWAKTTSGTTDEQIPFRARIFKTSAENGRDLLWQGEGLARQTSLTALLPASQSYLEVNTNDIIENDEALFVYEDDDRYELARCTSRVSGQIAIDESLVDASSWSIGSLILVVSEFNNVPWYNTDGNPSKANTIFLQIRHDGLVTDPDLTFYAQALAQSRGFVR
jgi:hypothetical protein